MLHLVDVELILLRVHFVFNRICKMCDFHHIYLINTNRPLTIYVLFLILTISSFRTFISQVQSEIDQFCQLHLFLFKISLNLHVR